MNPYISKHLRERQRPFDEKLRSDLEWQSWNWNVNWSQVSSSSQENETNHNKDNGKISSGDKRGNTVSLIHQSFFKILAHSYFFRLETLANVVRRRVKTEHLVVHTERYQRTRVGLSVSCFVLCFFQKSFHLIHVSSRHA